MSERRPSTDDQSSKGAQQNHNMHWLAMFTVAAYAWQLHGWLWAVTILIGIMMLISIGNFLILAASGNLALVRLNRWGWVFAALALIVLSGASIGQV